MAHSVSEWMINVGPMKSKTSHVRHVMRLLNSCDKITIIKRLGVCHNLLCCLLLPPFSEEKENRRRQGKMKRMNSQALGLKGNDIPSG